ncbi:hypothetical protein EXN66_Car008707 [Channa argus]|uniref:Uncharacterized protein n=1 Tax=Channa argus TaxID=215402 RepID=A0A6G1PRR4_CHAAH|nr:hypothetical protein EXN66_Car008707 [Channa argus]
MAVAVQSSLLFKKRSHMKPQAATIWGSRFDLHTGEVVSRTSQTVCLHMCVYDSSVIASWAIYAKLHASAVVNCFGLLLIATFVISLFNAQSVVVKRVEQGSQPTKHKGVLRMISQTLKNTTEDDNPSLIPSYCLDPNMVILVYKCNRSDILYPGTEISSFCVLSVNTTRNLTLYFTCQQIVTFKQLCVQHFRRAALSNRIMDLFSDMRYPGNSALQCQPQEEKKKRKAKVSLLITVSIPIINHRTFKYLRPAGYTH